MKINKSGNEPCHEETISRKQERQEEKARREQVHHYFLGPGPIWSQRGFPFLLGGLLLFALGVAVIQEYALGWPLHPPFAYALWPTFLLGGLAMAKGAYDVWQDRKKKSQPLPDQIFDQLFAEELTRIEARSRECLSQEIAEFQLHGELPMILVRGPREDLIRTKLPLLWKKGEDGFLRYSDLSIVALAFSEDNLYVYTCACNLRNGSIEIEHTYICPFAQIKYAALEHRVYERKDRRNSPVVRSVEMFTINAENQNRQDLTMPVKDYQMMSQLAGEMDIPEAKDAVKKIMEKVNKLMLEELKKKYNLVFS